MERSITAITFKGSVLEAVTEAKKQKKLFVVYVSGDDGDSVHLEQSTWMDSNVANSLSKYCVFLHLQDGSVNASQLSAIYPQKSVPCITVIGYNGLQLWQHEGHISPENLVTSIEKAWLTLHIQETTASFLTAALASNKSEASSSSPPNVDLSEEGSHSSFDQPSSLTDSPVQDSEKDSRTKQLSSKRTEEAEVCDSIRENVEPSSVSVHAVELENDQDKPSASSSQTASTSLQPVAITLENTAVETGSSDTGRGCSGSKEKIILKDRDNKFSPGSSQVIAKTVGKTDVGYINSHENITLKDQGEKFSPESPQIMDKGVGKSEVETNSESGCTDLQEKVAWKDQSKELSPGSVQIVDKGVNNSEVETVSLNVGGGCTDSQENIALKDQGNKLYNGSPQTRAKGVEIGDQITKPGAPDRPIDAYKSNDILLNIRLLDGASIQEKFLATDTLRLVKDYVDKKQASTSGLYDLAIPYPRKIFGDQELSKTLSELGLSNRQALIVVLRLQATRSQAGIGQSLSDQTYSGVDVNHSPDTAIGYWGSAKRLLSYINPLTYIGSSSSSSSSVERSNEGLWQYRPNSQIQGQSAIERPYSSENASRNRKSTSSRFGSNIHTLRHEEDDNPSKDRNTFWNGNSTEYGGNDKDK